jgi:hypothetical protein
MEKINKEVEKQVVDLLNQLEVLISNNMEYDDENPLECQKTEILGLLNYIESEILVIN